MKLVVLDGYTENPGDLSWAPLEALGEVTYYDRIGLTDEAVLSGYGNPVGEANTQLALAIAAPSIRRWAAFQRRKAAAKGKGGN